MANSLFKTIEKLVAAALLKQDSLTYHGSVGVEKLAADTANRIIQQVKAAQEDVEPLEAVLETTGPNITWNTLRNSKGEELSDPVWPAGWPLPRIGEWVTTKSGDSLQVTAVEWFPEDEDEVADINQPSVYIVLKP